MSSGEESAGRTLVLLNPSAGGGRARAVLSKLRGEPAWPRGCTVLEPGSAEEARNALRTELAIGEVGRLIAVGGDGTAHLAVNELLGGHWGEQTCFGLVPAGTGSDFARTLGLSRNPIEALHRVSKAVARKVDVIAADPDGGKRRFCLNIASAGLSGAVDEEVNKLPKRGSYLGATIRGLWRYSPKPCRVLVDGKQLTAGPFFLVAMANGRYFGKGMKVAPGAEIDDGWLDVVCVPPVPRWQLPWRLPQFLTGRHVRLPFVTETRAKEVRLEPSSGFPAFDLDGETMPPEPATFRVLPRALRLLA